MSTGTTGTTASLKPLHRTGRDRHRRRLRDRPGVVRPAARRRVHARGLRPHRGRSGRGRRARRPRLARVDVTTPRPSTRSSPRSWRPTGASTSWSTTRASPATRTATVLHTTPVEEWDRVLATNVRGPYLFARSVLPVMIDQGGGHVITIASVAGQVAFPGRSAYTASKGAALMLAKSIAVDYAAHGIRSNAVCPGMALTGMTKWRLDVPELRDAVESRIPLGRVADADDVADLVSLLASDRHRLHDRLRAGHRRRVHSAVTTNDSPTNDPAPPTPPAPAARPPAGSPARSRSSPGAAPASAAPPRCGSPPRAPPSASSTGTARPRPAPSSSSRPRAAAPSR